LKGEGLLQQEEKKRKMKSRKNSYYLRASWAEKCHGLSETEEGETAEGTFKGGTKSRQLKNLKKRKSRGGFHRSKFKA